MPTKKTNRPIHDAVHKLIRRTPKQARGQQRVNDILDAAERLTRTTSWDKLSTNHIAAEAGIPIGRYINSFPTSMRSRRRWWSVMLPASKKHLPTCQKISRP